MREEFKTYTQKCLIRWNEIGLKHKETKLVTL